MSFSGWVKQKEKKNLVWHKMFISLSRSFLTISKDSNLKQVQRTIDLNYDLKPTYNEGASYPIFSLTLPNQETILFQTQTKEIAQQWISLIQLNTLDNTSKPQNSSTCTSSPPLSMDQLEFKKFLSRNSYGKTSLYKKNDTNDFYAIKSIKKNLLNEAEKSNTIIFNQDITMKIDHPFLVNRCFSFETSSKFYIGLEYIPYKEFSYYIREADTIPIEDVRLYVAEIGLAISYLHSKNIIYRYLSPEQLILDSNGHIKITDFGFKEELNPSKDDIIVEYLAPEVVQQTPYSYPCDIWALGIITYEMLFYFTPFYTEDDINAGNTDNNKIISNIVSKEPSFPPDFDPIVVDFIQKLLTKEASKRPTFDQMKSHPFFKDFDWDKVYNKEYTPTYIPVVKDLRNQNNYEFDFDADSFDITQEDSVKSRIEKVDLSFLFMEYKIWRQFIQILSFRSDLIDVIKPFFEELKNNNNNNKFYFNEKNEEKFAFLNSLFDYQLELLEDNGILNECQVLGRNKFSLSDDEILVREIIKGDKMEEMQRLIREKGTNGIGHITNSFNEVRKMKIPIIIECIIQKAIKCFKYLLINGIEDPTITMQEQNPYPGKSWKNKHRYEWDCMGVAIYYGEVEIIKILEENGIEKGNNLIHIEAAVFSYRNPIVKEIINKMKEKNENNEKILDDILKRGTIK